MEPGLQRGDGRQSVQVIGRDDDQCIHAAFLAGQQGAEIVIGARRIEAEGGGGAPSLGWVLAERAANQLELTVERGGGAVNGADERPLRAAHHPVTDFIHILPLRRRARPSGRLASLRLPSSADGLVVASRSRSRAPVARALRALTAGRGS